MGILLIIVYPIYFLLIYYYNEKIQTIKYIIRRKRFNKPNISKNLKDSQYLIYQNAEKIHKYQYIKKH